MSDSAGIADSDVTAAPDGAARPTLLGRFQVDPTSPLPGLSRPGAKAFAATDLNEPRRNIYAVVADPHAPIRIRAYHQTRQVESESFVSPIRIGSVEWPATGQKETVLFVPRPAGTALMEDLNRKVDPVPHHRLMRVIMPALVELLQELQAVRVPHRAIRPDNIFLDAESEKVTLGECISVPAGMAQPAIFEPIERAMCLPAGRGEGESADDMFALGVTMLFLALGQNPAIGIEPDTLIARRRQLGSYAAIVGKKRVPPELIQVLRSLMRDDVSERWTIEDLAGWLESGRGTAAPSSGRVESDRPFEFGEKKYKTATSLAYGLGNNWSAAREVVAAGKVEKWVEKVLKEKRVCSAIARCRISGSGGPRAISDDLLLARTLIALDPAGPIRYRSLVTMPDGIGSLMASLIGDEARTREVVELLNGMLTAFWIEQNNRPSYAMFTADENLARVMPLLQQSAPGFGVERALYELNQNLVCQSPLLRGANVGDLTQLLKALDERGGGHDEIFDRHVAAFVAARISGSIDRDLNDIALARSTGDKLLAQLRLLAYVQGKSDADELPGLCNWFIARSPAILETYRNLPLRARLAKAVRTAAETGELARVAKVLGSEKNRRWDQRNFTAARRLFRDAEDNIASLQASLQTIPERSRSAGRQIGAIAASGIGVVVTVVVMLTNVA